MDNVKSYYQNSYFQIIIYGHNYIIMGNIYNTLIIKNLVLIIYKNKKYLIRCFNNGLTENTISIYFWRFQAKRHKCDRPSNLDSGEIVGVTSKYASNAHEYCNRILI